MGSELTPPITNASSACSKGCTRPMHFRELALAWPSSAKPWNGSPDRSVLIPHPVTAVAFTSICPSRLPDQDLNEEVYTLYGGNREIDTIPLMKAPILILGLFLFAGGLLAQTTRVDITEAN